MVGSVLSGIKISAAIDASASSTAATWTTVYTCPANCYAILNVRATPGTNDVAVRVGTAQIIYISTTFTAYEQYVLQNVEGIYLGPSQTIDVSRPNVGGTATCWVSGVLFINTP